jgi:hypothetical protein
MLMKLLKNKDMTEEEVADLTSSEIAELIRSDPVTCMRHFDHRYRALLNLILEPNAGLFYPYELQDHFSRVEFQMRGSPHSHGLYWIKDAPQYVEGNYESELACIKFIDKFITSERCEDGEMENLIGYQIHNHTRTCKKKARFGVSCRFGYPKPPLDKTQILEPLPLEMDPVERKEAQDLFKTIQAKLNEMGNGFKEDIEYYDFLNQIDVTNVDYITAIRTSIKRRTVFLKRSTNAIFVNGYNRQLLEAWGANIDIQFVLDTYACAKYCVGYIMKSEGGVSRLLQEATQEARRGNKTIQEKLNKFSNVLINGTEISAQEAAAFLLGLPNTSCSRSDVFINTAPSDERIGFLKPQDELENLDDESPDVCVKGLIDHYMKRPQKLDKMCLAEFASMHNIVGTGKETSPPDESLQHGNDYQSNLLAEQALETSILEGGGEDDGINWHNLCIKFLFSNGNIRICYDVLLLQNNLINPKILMQVHVNRLEQVDRF